MKGEALNPDARALQVGKAILDAHGQWEIEHNRCYGKPEDEDQPWQDRHITLLGHAAILAMEPPQ